MSSIVVLGGAGFQGTNAARQLVRRTTVAEVVVADVSGDRAAAAADELGPDAVPAICDAQDRDAVAALLRRTGAAVMLNCAGPFRRTGPVALEAAVDAGVHYVDLLDDATMFGSFFALSDRAAAAGVTALVGMGFTPGLSNVLGRLLADGLDEVHELHWTFLVNVDTAARHLMAHRVQMFGPDAAVVRAGELGQVPGGSLELTLDWGRYGLLTAAACTHTEPLSAQRYFPGLREAVMRGSYTAEGFLRLLTALGNAGLGDTSTIGSACGEITPEQFIEGHLNSPLFARSVAWQRVMEAEERHGPVDGLRVVAAGIRDGRPVVDSAAYLSPKRWHATHATAAVGAELLATGELSRPGVHAPEAFDPKPVLRVLGDAAGIEVTTRTEDAAPEVAPAGVR